MKPAAGPHDPVPEFLAALQTRRAEAMEPYLHPEVVYSVVDFPALVGRRAVLAFWRRLFTGLSDLEVAVKRQIRDENLIVSNQQVRYLAEGRDPLITESFVIFELEDGRIRSWADNLRAADLDSDTRTLWTRLRTAAW